MSQLVYSHTWTASDDSKLQEAVACYLDWKDAAEGSLATWWALVVGRASIRVSHVEARRRWLDLVEAAGWESMTLALGLAVQDLEAELAATPAINLGRAVRRLRTHVADTRLELDQAMIMSGELLARLIDMEEHAERMAQREVDQ